MNVRWIGDSLGDPYLPDGTLIVSPDETRPLRSGERYLTTVSRRVAERASGWEPPPEANGFDSAVATVFTVQDHVAELGALRRAADALLDGDPSLLQPTEGLREVASVSLAPGTTPSGRAATVETVAFVDSETERSFRSASSAPVRTIDLTTGPMTVYQVTIHTAAFQDPAGRPYQSPGLGIIGDTARSDAWIEFDATGALLRAPMPEPMRIVVLVPRASSGFALVDWGHGSGGDAHEPIARTDPADDLAGIRLRLAELGAIVVSGDHPLFGTRFPFMELGFANNLLVVNIPNLPAFRANFPQGAMDQHVRRRFAREVLPSLFGPGLVDASRREGAFGHSFQLVVDGADPLAVAREHEIAVDAMGGENDSKVPPEGFLWLAAPSRNGTLAPSTPSSPFDGHVCVFREPAELLGFTRLLGAE